VISPVTESPGVGDQHPSSADMNAPRESRPAEAGQDAGTADPSSAPPTKKPRRRSWIYAVVAFAVVIAVILAAWTLTGGFGTKKNVGSPTVLDPEGTYFTIPGGQFNAVTLLATANATIQGTFTNTYGIILYTMNPTQFHHLVISGGNASAGYEWTSGTVGRGIVYKLDVTVPPGPWDLAFVNPSPINTTLVGFYSDLTLSES